MHVAVFGSSTISPGDPWYAAGIDLGRGIAGLGLPVATGGYGGMMEAVSRGAAEAGGRVIGVTAPGLFPHRGEANRWVDEEITTTSIAERIGMLVEGAVAAVAMPGALGTLTELAVSWNEVYINGSDGLAVCTVGEAWATFVAEYAPILGAPAPTCVETSEDAIRWLTRLQSRL
jgi:uncharacterized protein (TIGR00725 family)